MKFILYYLKEYKWYATLAPLFKMLEAIFELLVPLVVARIIDTGIANADRAYVLRMSFVLLALALLGTTVSITAQYFAAKAAVLSTGRMREDVYDHIQDFSDAAMDRIGASTLITRITSDLNQVQGGINMALRLFLRSPFIVVGAMIMAGTISWKALCLFAAIILMLSALVAGLMRHTIPMYQEVQRRLEGLLTLARENLEGARVIRAFAIGERERDEFARRNTALYETAYGAGKLQSYLNPATFALVNLGIIVLLWRSGVAVNAGTLTTGETVALYNYLSQILIELVKFANLIVQITRAYASVGRVEEIMRVVPDERVHEVRNNAVETEQRIGTDERVEFFERSNGTEGNTPSVKQEKQFGEVQKNDDILIEQQEQENGDSVLLRMKENGNSRNLSVKNSDIAIQFSNVTFSYNQSKRALEELTFSVPQGTALGIVGGTGAGKSTVVRLLRHAYDATAGEVQLFGQRVESISDEQMARIVSNVPQKVELFAGTVEGNLRLGNPEATDEELITALKTAQAYDFVVEKGGLSAEVRKGGSNFSGGQRQRLSIARAIAAKTQILILDDATSALDAATERALLEKLREDTTKTTIIVSQRSNAVKNADHILVMDGGWCIGGGTHEELLAGNDVYREIVEAAQ